MNILVYDTETTGLLNKNLPLDGKDQPRLVQLAAVLLNTEDWIPQGVMAILVSPENFTIPIEAEIIHGISNNRANSYGVSVSYALHIFATLAQKAEQLYAYNADFDIGLIVGELLRLHRLDVIPHVKDTICVMKPLTSICKIPGIYGYKWPKLSEAYTYFYKEPAPTNAHDALIDVSTTIKVLRAYLERN